MKNIFSKSIAFVCLLLSSFLLQAQEATVSTPVQVTGGVFDLSITLAPNNDATNWNLVVDHEGSIHYVSGFNHIQNTSTQITVVAHPGISDVIEAGQSVNILIRILSPTSPTVAISSFTYDGQTGGETAPQLIEWQQNDNNQAFINPEFTGNVGIGTTDPQGNLQIGSRFLFQDFRFITKLGYNCVFEEVVSPSGIPNVSVNYLENGAASSIEFSEIGGIFFQTAPSGQANDLVSFSRPLTLTPSGHVAMGGTSFVEDYQLTVTGGIITDRIKIAEQGSEDWPDYVFGEDYQLMSLAEVEAFIEENNHLPNVPSAAEVQENGQDLSQMNKVLLEKVEELTLYNIQLAKESKSLQEESKAMLEQLKALQKEVEALKK